MTNLPYGFDPYYKWLGIPPKDQPPNHYRLLGIERFETDHDVIEAAANRLMAYLQDLSGGEEAAPAQQLLNEVSSARLCLLHVEKKSVYDTALRQEMGSQAAAPPVPPPPPTSSVEPPPLVVPTTAAGKTPPAQVRTAVPPPPTLADAAGHSDSTGGEAPSDEAAIEPPLVVTETATPKTRRSSKRAPPAPQFDALADLETPAPNSDSGGNAPIGETSPLVVPPSVAARRGTPKTVARSEFSGLAGLDAAPQPGEAPAGCLPPAPPRRENIPKPAVPAAAVPAAAVPAAAAPQQPGKRSQSKAFREESASSWNKPVVWITGCGVVAVVILLVLIFSHPASDATRRPRGHAPVRRTPQSRSSLRLPVAIVQLHLASEQREVTVEVDGYQRELTLENPVQYRLTPGHHRIKLTRPGYEPLERSVNLRDGAPFVWKPEWIARRKPVPDTNTPPADVAEHRPARPAPGSAVAVKQPRRTTGPGPAATPPAAEATRPAPPLDPLAGIMPEVDLPVSDGAAEASVALGTIPAKVADAVQLRLLGGDTLLGPSSRLDSAAQANRRAWQVQLSGAAGSATVGEFALTGQRLTFIWHSPVSSEAEVLRNCLLRLDVGEASGKAVRLRTPVSIEPLMVADPTSVAISILDVPGVPDSSLLRIQVLKLSGPAPYRQSYESVVLRPKDPLEVRLTGKGSLPIVAHLSLVSARGSSIRVDSAIKYQKAMDSPALAFFTPRSERELSERMKARAALQLTYSPDLPKEQQARIAAARKRLDRRIAYLRQVSSLRRELHKQVRLHCRVFVNVGSVKVVLADST